MIDKLAYDLGLFMGSKNKRNTWLDSPPISIYVRKGYHLVDGKVRSTLDIASVTVEERQRSKGHFTEFLDWVENLGVPLYVESILEPRLVDYLKRRGYQIFNQEGCCAFKEGVYELRWESYLSNNGLARERNYRATRRWSALEG